MEIKQTRRLYLTLYQKSIEWLKVPGSNKWTYSLNKNIKLIESALKELDSISKPTENIKQFEDERLKLCEKHCEKDKDGKPIIENGNYKMKNQGKFDKEIEKLKINYPTLDQEKESIAHQVGEYLDTEIYIDLHKIEVEELPSIGQFELLKMILKQSTDNMIVKPNLQVVQG